MIMSKEMKSHEFQERFKIIDKFQDSFSRQYMIVEDTQLHCKAVSKYYLVENQEATQPVLQNLQNYEKLSEFQGLCGIIAFSQLDDSQICAVFQYSDINLQDYIKKKKYQPDRLGFYILIIRQITELLDILINQGIQLLDDFNLKNILIVNENEINKIKVLYDERHKFYDKILNGQKIYWSAEKANSQILHNEDYPSVNGDENIFQLGLLLIDVIYEIESNTSYEDSIVIKNGDVIARDSPMKRTNQNSSYYNLKDKNAIVFNEFVVNHQIKYLLQLPQPILRQLVECLIRMIAVSQKRLSLEQLIVEVDRLQKIFKDSSKKIRKQYSANQHLQHQQYQSSRNHYIDTVIQTKSKFPIHTNSKTDNPELFEIKSKVINNPKIHDSIAEKLKKTFDYLDGSNRMIRKNYNDGSVYYGQIDELSQKRSGTGVYLYVGGDVYYGNWLDNDLVSGTYIFKNGESYEGTVKKGKQGWGRYRYSNGNVYEGQWKDDFKNGKGTMDYPNGDKYHGMWQRGKKNGDGKYFYNNGTIFDGIFKNGRKLGHGTILFPNKTKIEAFWNQTHVEGFGKVYYNNGDYFEGNYQKSEKDGYGQYIWNDCKYDGDFKKDTLQGKAKITFTDSEYYEGIIKNCKRQGQGIYKYSNGDYFTGEWKNNDKIIGIYSFANGDSFEGRFKDNQLNFGVMTYHNGEIYDGEFQNGQRHGVGIYKDHHAQVVYQGHWQQDIYKS